MHALYASLDIFSAILGMEDVRTCSQLGGASMRTLRKGNHESVSKGLYDPGRKKWIQE